MAVISTWYLIAHKEQAKPSKKVRIIELQTFFMLLLASSGWALCCLCYLWIFEPFGSYPSRWDLKKFYGVILAFPALVVFFLGLKLLRNKL